jgi:hypothetical protein
MYISNPRLLLSKHDRSLLGKRDVIHHATVCFAFESWLHPDLIFRYCINKTGRTGCWFNARNQLLDRGSPGLFWLVCASLRKPAEAAVPVFSDLIGEPIRFLKLWSHLFLYQLAATRAKQNRPLGKVIFINLQKIKLELYK